VYISEELLKQFPQGAELFPCYRLVPDEQQEHFKQQHHTVDTLASALRQQFSANQLRGAARRQGRLSKTAAAETLAHVFGSPTNTSPSSPTCAGPEFPTAARTRGLKRPRSPPSFPADSRDPITLEPLSESAHVFTYKRSAESIGAFDLETLVQYITMTGDFRDPETRVPFSKKVMDRLDRDAQAAGFPSPLKARACKQEQYRDQDTTLMAITGVERLAHDFLSESMELLEHAPFNAGFAQVQTPPCLARHPPRTPHAPTSATLPHTALLQSKWQLELFPQLCNVLEQMAGLDRGMCGTSCILLH
jgi:hypothetical protein